MKQKNQNQIQNLLILAGESFGLIGLKEIFVVFIASIII